MTVKHFGVIQKQFITILAKLTHNVMLCLLYGTYIFEICFPALLLQIPTSLPFLAFFVPTFIIYDFLNNIFTIYGYQHLYH